MILHILVKSRLLSPSGAQRTGELPQETACQGRDHIVLGLPGIPEVWATALLSFEGLEQEGAQHITDRARAPAREWIILLPLYLTPGKPRKGWLRKYAVAGRQDLKHLEANPTIELSPRVL